MDLIIRRARLRRAKTLVDIAIKDGKFSAIDEHINTEGKKEIDADGNLVTPPFVESHVHLDAALSVGNPRYNQSGTLLEAIDIWSDYKKDMVKADIKKRAKQAISWLIANGVLHVRTHTDISDPELMLLEAMLELKDELEEDVDIQIVAFPQDGIFAYKGMDKRLQRALEKGADVVGGMPQGELTREDGIRSITYAFDLAETFSVPIDIHTDETSDEQSRFTEVIVKYAMERGMTNSVTASHATAMHNYENDYAAKLIGNIKRAGINIVTNPFSNALLQNRLEGYPRRRGHTRIDELHAAGINVSIGNDNIMDPFGPVGKGSMLQAAHLLLHHAHLSDHEQIKDLFDMITTKGAKTLGLNDYGIEIGHPANVIILDASDEIEAIRLTSECLYVIREGRVISTAKPAKRRLMLARENMEVDFKL